MSGVTLHCPHCDAPAPPRIETNVAPVVQRYTCGACRKTVLREDLVIRRHLRTVVGGVDRGRRGAPSETNIVLRPPGVYGDSNTTTYLEARAGTATTIDTGWSASVGEEHDSPIDAIQLYFVYHAFVADQGPLDPTVRFQFRQGASGTIRNASSVVGTVSGLTTVGPFTVSTNESGGAWTWPQLASLQFNLSADVDDNGSQNETVIRLAEVWAQVVP